MEKYRPHTYEGESTAERPDIRADYVPVKRNFRQLISEQFPTPKEKIKFVRETLTTIDQKVLLNLFREYYGRCGLDISTVPMTPVANVSVIYRKAEGSSGSHGEDGIVLNAAHLHTANEIFIALMHEYVHEISTNEDYWVRYDESGENIQDFEQISQSGIQKVVVRGLIDVEKDEVTTQDTEETGRFLNEGITQIITDDIFAEYRRRVGGKETQEQIIHQETGFSKGYAENQFYIQLYIIFTSVLTDVPEEVVKNAIVRTYLRNSELIPEELDEVLQTELGYDGKGWFPKPHLLLADTIKRYFSSPSDGDAGRLLREYAETLPDKEKGRELIEKVDELISKWDTFYDLLLTQNEN